MDFIKGIILIFILILCHPQTYSYPTERRSGYSYNQSSKTYQYTSSSDAATSASLRYNTFLGPADTNSYYKQSSQRNSSPYSSSSGSYAYKSHLGNKGSIENHNYVAPPLRGYHFSTSSSYLPLLSNVAKSVYTVLDSVNTKPYINNSYNLDNNKKDTSKGRSFFKHRVSKTDSENGKFVGAENQEDEEDGRTLHLKRRKFHRRFGEVLANPCFSFGRDASSGVTSLPKEQGRFLWDINVYNVYPQMPAVAGCGGYSGLGGGFLSDPIALPPYYPPGAGIANFLSLFAPGILQNSLAVTARPPLFADQTEEGSSSSQSSNDPNYRPAPLPVRRPHQIFYDSAGAPPITPGQLVGGISTTVNGIIQQLTGNVQPVYG